MDVLLIQAGIVADCICADSIERAQQFYPDFTCMQRPDGVGTGWTFDGATFAAPVEVPVPRMPITKRAFLDRFTQAQRIAIRTARDSDPIVGDAMYMLDLADDVDLTNADTIAFVGYLAQANLIAPSDVEGILS